MFKTSDDAQMSTLSVLWLVNSCVHCVAAGFSDKLIRALWDAEIPLYYINEDFDSNIAFNEYRLTDAANENARMQATCAEFDDLDTSSRDTCSDYFAKGVCDYGPLSLAAVPLWFGANVSIGIAHDVELELSETVRVASLFVKVIDVKSACQRQGIGTFYWPTEHPYLRHDRFVAYELEMGLWCRVLLDRRKARRPASANKDLLLQRRIACVLSVLHDHHVVLGSGTKTHPFGKLPPVRKIYEWVKNDQSFCKNGDACRESIAFSTFNQLFKEQLRMMVLERLVESSKFGSSNM